MWREGVLSSELVVFVVIGASIRGIGRFLHASCAQLETSEWGLKYGLMSSSLARNRTRLTSVQCFVLRIGRSGRRGPVAAAMGFSGETPFQSLKACSVSGALVGAGL